MPIARPRRLKTNDVYWLPLSLQCTRPTVRATARDGHLRCVADELGSEACGQCPAGDRSRVAVHHRRQIPGPDIFDVRAPQAVGRRHVEVARHQVRRGLDPPRWSSSCRGGDGPSPTSRPSASAAPRACGPRELRGRGAARRGPAAPACNSGAPAVISRTRGALLLSRRQASVAEFRRQTFTPDEGRVCG